MAVVSHWLCCMILTICLLGNWVLIYTTIYAKLIGKNNFLYFLHYINFKKVGDKLFDLYFVLLIEIENFRNIETDIISSKSIFKILTQQPKLEFIVFRVLHILLYLPISLFTYTMYNSLQF
jgi:hypothetical protein